MTNDELTTKNGWRIKRPGGNRLVIRISLDVRHSSLVIFSALALRVSPTHLVEFFQLSDEQIQDETDESDHHHAGNDEVVAFAGVAGVDNQVTEAAVDRDHFRGNHHKPGHTEGDANSGDD